MALLNQEVFEKGGIPAGYEREAINEVIDEMGVVNYNVEVSAGSKHGDNYMGSIYRIIVKGTKKGTNQSIRLDLILKTSPRLNSLRQTMPIDRFFDREINAYTEVLPVFLNLQKKFNISKDGILGTAIVYKHSDTKMDEFLLMKDLKPEGFVMLDRKLTFDLDHLTIVLRQLAAIHAYMFILRDQDKVTFERLVEIGDDNFFKYANDDFKNQSQHLAIKALKTLDPELDKDVYNCFQYYVDNFFDILENIATAVDQYSVLCHGDCWNNNMQFKYEDPENPTKPTDVRLLDWQIMRMGSPVLDLSYFIYNCTSTETRKAHFDTLLKIYHSHLSFLLRKMGSNPDILFPFHELQNQCKKYFRYGVLMACFTIHLFTSDSDEIPSFAEMELDGNVDFSKWSFESKNNEIFKERLSNIIRHGYDNGFLDIENHD